MNVEYFHTLDGILPEQLTGFFEGWPNPPSPSTHLTLLRNSDEVVLAVDTASGNVIGLITVLTDRVLSAFIPLLEVRADFRENGIGAELVRRATAQVQSLYMVDLLCDETVQPFYESLGFTYATGACLRCYENQSGQAL